MDTPFISGPQAVDDATQLISIFGEDAGYEAAARAETSRANGNVIRYCHWRQIERLIVALGDREAAGTIH
ncbi:hypothetical protein [Sphingomicrobium clamense]|uniref:Uncharacterized protein n=1 Tax=Sphingomicrobium clamense TaxID=2851013 RepID=A0ABS6V773_9SPHN|nr:hypothetical protein [Sphingomicrobium sp. B8]MBW0145420.1 hypothetical protein [Sphingomicrobium sp. B8]